MTRSRRPLALALAALLALAGSAAAQPAAAPAPAAPTGGMPADSVAGDMSLGNPKAKVHVVEYASASCPHCAHFDEETFPAFKKTYVDTGRVYFTLKEFLTAPPDVAIAGFLLARCGGKAKYFAILDQVFKSQEQWSTTPIATVFLKIAADNGLSKDQVQACLGDPKALEELKTRVVTAAQVDKIDSTPTFVINGKQLKGNYDLKTLDAAIVEAEKAAPKAGAAHERAAGKAKKR